MLSFTELETNKPPSTSSTSQNTLAIPPPASLIATTSPSSQPFLTSSELRDRTVKLKDSKKPYTMDLTIFCSKKKVHKSAVIRERCKRRLGRRLDSLSLEVRGIKEEK